MTTDTRDEILTDWRRIQLEIDGDEATRRFFMFEADAAEVTYDAYLDNHTQNVVERAVKAGLIAYDGENNGWHEGWSRMLRALDTIASEGR